VAVTVPYARSRQALYRPGEATDFFSLGGSSGDAALCVEMARLAYVKAEPALRLFLARAGFDLAAFMTRAGSQGFVAEDASTVVVAFRGSEPDDSGDLLADADLRLTPWPAGGRVHAGFARALQAVWEEVRPSIAPGKRLLFSGHSLGAALATLASTLVRPAALYTFGSPRVGDDAFVRAADLVDHYRYVDCCDGVCDVPPEPLGYRHCGRALFIDRHGAIHGAHTSEQMNEERRAAARAYVLHLNVLTQVALRQLADHAPLNYSSAVLGVRER
jgi:hypothetical protein